MESRLLTHLTFLLATQSNDDGVRETRGGHIRPHLWTPLAAALSKEVGYTEGNRPLLAL